MIDGEIARLMLKDTRNKAIIGIPSLFLGMILGGATYRVTDEFIPGEIFNVPNGDEGLSFAVGLVSFLIASFLIRKKTGLVTNSFGI